MKQKAEERLVMEYFRESWPDFPRGRLVPSESPDYILRMSPKKSIGIELTRLDTEEGDPETKIIQSVERKNSKHALYRRKKFHDVWLLIYDDDAGNLNPKGHQLLIPETDFGKIFLFSLFDRKILEVK